MMSLKIDGCIVAGGVVTIQLNRAADSRGERDYQARLFVAAPEMYEALQMFLAYNDQGGPLHFDTDAMWAKARSVVAKIEGGGE